MYCYLIPVCAFSLTSKATTFLNCPSCSESRHPGGRSEVTENVARPSQVAQESDARPVAVGASGDSLSLWQPHLCLCNVPVLEREVCWVSGICGCRSQLAGFGHASLLSTSVMFMSGTLVM